MIEYIKTLIANGEGQRVEFKKAKNDFPKDAYETICAFLNAEGGTLLLGVSDEGTILGVNPNSVDKIKTTFVTGINNPELINPASYLTIHDIEIDGKIILYIQVSNASSVYRYKSRIYLRNHSSDIDITDNQEEVTRLYLRTDNTYSENQIYPYFEIESLRLDLINKVKKVVKMNNPQLDWTELTTKEFLQKNKLYRHDKAKNQEGITLAGILLFGTDDQIEETLPSYKFEIAKCVDDNTRYDDRITLRTNLIESVDIVLRFIEKYLPSPFYLEGIQRIDLRTNIFREIVANMLVHKEYLAPEPSKLIIYKDKIIAQNSNIPHIKGLITLKNTTNFSKNPQIVKMFRLLGIVEDFGTGIPKLFKFCEAYTGYEPIIEDEKLFTLSLKHNFFTRDQARDQAKATNNNKNEDFSNVRDQVRDQAKILDFCKTPKSMKEIMNYCSYSNKTKFRDNFIKPLLQADLLKYTLPKTPKSPNQKYVTA
jgi:ATP-dependent DNA helicase RecG